MKNLLTTLIFFGGELSLYIALTQFVTKNRGIMHYIMAFLLICLGIIQLRACLLIAGVALSYPYLLVFHLPVNFSIGPLLYLYFQALLDSRFRIDMKKSLHFLPAFILFFIELIPMIVIPGEEYSEIRKEIIRGIHSPILSAHIVTVKLFLLSAVVYTVSYQIAIIKSALTLYKLKEMDAIKRILFFVICVSVLSPVALFLGLITDAIAFLIIGMFIISALVMFTYIIAQRQYDLLHHLSLDMRRKRYERSLLKGVNINNIQRRLSELMEEEKTYADSTITLPALAEKLLITPHQLSEFLNEMLNMNFNTFINKHRIDEAIELLSHDSDLSVLQIAYSVGFNSKSVFNSAFQKFTGTTPHNFRKEKKSSHHRTDL